MSKPQILALVITITFVISSESKVVHDTPRTLLKRKDRSSQAPPPPPSSAFVPTYDDTQTAFLKAHNDLRRKVGAPPLSWDANLTAVSHAWAMQRKEDCNYRHHSHGHYGENLFWMKYAEVTPAAVVLHWFNEQQYFDHTTNHCKCEPERDGCECGHYLNVIWKTTTKVGCSGIVFCDNAKGVYIACSYYPPGNIKGINPLNPIYPIN